MIRDLFLLAVGDEATRARYQQLVELFRHDFWGTAGAMLYAALIEPIVTDWQEGRYGEAIGRGVFEILPAILSIVTGGAAASSYIGKAGAVGKAADAVASAGQAAHRVDDVARIASPLDEAGQVASPLDEAGQVASPLDEAGQVVAKVDEAGAAAGKADDSPLSAGAAATAEGSGAAATIDRLRAALAAGATVDEVRAAVYDLLRAGVKVRALLDAKVPEEAIQAARAQRTPERLGIDLKQIERADG